MRGTFLLNKKKQNGRLYLADAYCTSYSHRLSHIFFPCVIIIIIIIIINIIVITIFIIVIIIIVIIIIIIIIIILCSLRSNLTFVKLISILQSFSTCRDDYFEKTAVMACEMFTLGFGPRPNNVAYLSSLVLVFLRISVFSSNSLRYGTCFLFQEWQSRKLVT